MLSFDSALSNSLKSKNTTAFWVLKLYYNDESAFIGVSDIDRKDGTDMYHGLVSSFGSYSQSLDFFNFTTSTGNMSIRLINTDRVINGGRFSDLFSSNNFANRKWELFLNTSSTSTLDTSARMIGTGVISGDIKYDYNSITFTLLDKASFFHKQVPSSTVTSSTYSDAPEKNIGKPVPMSYGDFDRTTSDANYNQFLTKGKFPAIITNRCNASGQIEALPDTDQGSAVKLGQLRDTNVYMVVDSEFLAALSSNVSITANPSSTSHNLLRVSGVRYFHRVPLVDSFTSSEGLNGTANIVDDSLATSQAFDSTQKIDGTGTHNFDLTFNVPKIPKLGELYDNDDIILVFKTSGVIAQDGSGVETKVISGTTLSPAITTDGIHTANLSSKYSDDELSSVSLDSDTITVRSTVATGNGDNRLRFNLLDMFLKIEYRPSQIFTKKIQEEYEFVSYALDQYHSQDNGIVENVKKTRTKTLNTPAVSDYIYFSGTGREFGSWIDADSRNNGYNSGDLIENPVYIIEDILRTELGLSSSNIDYESFDEAGNTTNGHIKQSFNDAIADIKFSFSQYKFINSLDLIYRLCKQSFTFVFLGGDGKFKIKTLLRPGDTFTADKTIDFNAINLKSISRTSLNSTRNDITIKYDYDYANDQILNSINTTDSTSAGTTVNGVNQSLKLTMEAEGILDDTTATQLADGYINIFKDRKVIIDFNIITPEYNDLEISDYVTFSNWDTNLKLYGTAFNSDFFMITKITKNIDGCSIQAIKADS
tara:strand:- start:1233 stop:3524 length:2292 start_codon:yes stop_codon:yes gene_type:complete